MLRRFEKALSCALALVLSIGLVPAFSIAMPEQAYAEGEWNDTTTTTRVTGPSVLSDWRNIQAPEDTDRGQWFYDDAGGYVYNKINTQNLGGYAHPTADYTDIDVSMSIGSAFSGSGYDLDDDGLGIIVRSQQRSDTDVDAYVFIMDAVKAGASESGMQGSMIKPTELWYAPGAQEAVNQKGSIAGLYKITGKPFEMHSLEFCQAASTPNLRWVMGTYQPLRVVANGNNIKVYFNGKLEIDYTDPNAITHGSFGFFSISQPDARFKDIEYTVTHAQYKLTFDPNGRRAKINGQSDPQTFDVVAMRPFSPDIQNVTATRSGYTFAGWNTKADGSGKHYAADYFTNPDTRVELTEDTTLYAQWTRGSYTIAYDANGGEDDTVPDGGPTGMAPQTVAFDADDCTLTPMNFKKLGYHFASWNTQPDGSGTSLSDEQRIEENLTESIGDTVTLYAQWVPNTFTFRFEPNGATEGLDTMPNQTFTYDQLDDAFLKLNTFSRPGYQFKGWKSYEPGPNDITDIPDGYRVNNFTSKNGFTDEDPIVLLAQWGAGEYKIAFDANGGVGEMEELTCVFDQPYSLPGSSFSRTGYDFTGWCKVKDGNTINPDDFVEDVATVQNFALDGETVTLYAQWSPHKYKVRYQGGPSATGTAPTEQLCTYDKSYQLAGNTFSRMGYGFDGWKCVRGLEDLSTIRQPGDEFSNLSADDGAEIVYEAQWSPLRYIIRFDGNGATNGHIDDIFVTFDTYPKLGWTTVYSRDGYQVDDRNWTRVDTGEKYECGMNIPNNLTTKHNEVITFRAEWIPNTYYVNYSHGGFGSGTMSMQTFEYGSAQALARNSFTRPGYVFAGWKTDINGEEKMFSDGQTVTDLTTTNNQVLYLEAQWVKAEYACTYDGNGTDAGVMEPTPIEYYLHPFYLASNAFTKTGYTFTGWNNKADGTGIAKKDKDEVRYHWGSDADHPGSAEDYTLTAYAQWRPNTYDVVFEAGTSAYGTQESVTYTYDEKGKLPHRTIYKDGARFTGWKATIDGEDRIFADEAEVFNLTTRDKDVIVMYAQWSDSSYAVHFEPNGGNGSMPDQVFGYNDVTKLSKNTFSRTGYIFTGWNTEPMGTGYGYADEREMHAAAEVGTTLTFYAQWAPVTYTLRFDGNGANSGSIDDVSMSWNDEFAIPPDAFSRDGYVLAGYRWDGGSCADGATISKVTQQNGRIVTLSAIWVPSRYRIVFDANGGTGNMSPIDTIYDADVVLPRCEFSYGGKTFIGWNTDPHGAGQMMQPGQEVSNLASEHISTITLYAQWRGARYSVSFDAAGAMGTMENIECDVQDRFEVPRPSFEKKGYLFDGWRVTNGNMTGSVLRPGESSSSLANSDGQEVTLTAMWKPVTYTIVLHANDGSGRTSEIACEYDKSYDIPAAFKRTGHTLRGYGKAAASAVADVEIGSTARNWCAEQGGVVELWGVWSETTYSILFDANGGAMTAGSIDMPSVSFSQEVTLPSSDTVVRDGYKFIAWATSANGTGTSFKAGQKVSGLSANAPVTLYAQWEKESDIKPPVKPDDSNTNQGSNTNTGSDGNGNGNNNTGNDSNSNGNQGGNSNNNSSSNNNHNAGNDGNGNNGANGDNSGDSNGNMSNPDGNGSNSNNNVNGDPSGSDPSVSGADRGNEGSAPVDVTPAGDTLNSTDGGYAAGDLLPGTSGGSNDNADTDTLTATGDGIALVLIISGMVMSLTIAGIAFCGYIRRRSR